jgi:hypothetical protein
MEPEVARGVYILDISVYTIAYLAEFVWMSECQGGLCRSTQMQGSVSVAIVQWHDWNGVLYLLGKQVEKHRRQAGNAAEVSSMASFSAVAGFAPGSKLHVMPCRVAFPLQFE